MKKYFSLLILIILAGNVIAAKQDIAIIPQPCKVELRDGYFKVTGGTVFCYDSSAGLAASENLRRQLGKAAGKVIPVVELSTDTIPGNSICFMEGKALGNESYELIVTKERIIVRASGHVGFVYGTQTLFQLLPPVFLKEGQKRDLVIQCVSISDKPRFRWRGLMLDCSRTFQSIDYLKKTIDRMCLYKMNVLHLHLTDDQGWRLEIKKYPELTKKGAFFPDKYNEPARHEGFYTQKQMKELVEYARLRGITIVPEIEMPGHSLAVLSCYPHLSCTGGPFEIFPFFKGQNITSDIYCAGNEQTFEFMEDVLTEVIELFPSEYIHIGGDEAPKARWQKCSKCQARIKSESLKDEHELQSYFIRRIERFVNSKGRKIIGWDEILEGGLAPNAAVMSWRGIKGGIAAAGTGHNVVMSPTSHCYFDYKYSAIDSQKAYSFEPVPEQLDKSQEKYILGLQANFWSHIDKEEQLVDHQLFPRLLAIAERGWSPKENRDWGDFERRQSVHLDILDKLGVSYRRRPIGRWLPEQMSEDYKQLQWDVTEYIQGPGVYQVRFEYTKGAHRLGIREVSLCEGSEVVFKDTHRGVTGASHENNSYTAKLDTYSADEKYVITASLRSEGGTDSTGEVYFRKIN